MRLWIAVFLILISPSGLLIGFIYDPTSPLQIDKNKDLSENVGVTDALKTHITHHTQSIEVKRYYCNSVAEGFMKNQSCKA